MRDAVELGGAYSMALHHLSLATHRCAAVQTNSARVTTCASRKERHRARVFRKQPTVQQSKCPQRLAAFAGSSRLAIRASVCAALQSARALQTRAVCQAAGDARPVSVQIFHKNDAMPNVMGFSEQFYLFSIV
jgi:hypothetical protein